MAHGMNINLWPRAVYVVRMGHNGDHEHTLYRIPWNNSFHRPRMIDLMADYRISNDIRI